jgi:hypothetical protein
MPQAAVRLASRTLRLPHAMPAGALLAPPNKKAPCELTPESWTVKKLGGQGLGSVLHRTQPF